MAASLFSGQWYRVAGLRPRLRTAVRVRRQQSRGQRWYLLSDAATGRQHRINDSAYQLIGRCDGRRTVDEVWNALLEAQGDAAPTQDEVLRLLGQLGEMELLHADRAADVHALLQRRDDRRRQRRRVMLNPFSFRLPLANPTPWLAGLDPLARVLVRPLTFWLWLLGMLVAAVVAATEWPALRSHAAQHLISSRSLALAWFTYPIMKALHELGHALAVRRWGGEVTEVGIGLICLVPAPYVDASAATAFPRRAQRAAVGAAGVMVELALAGLAFGVWLLVEPGWVRDTAFSVMFIGVASTLLFNGNPLLRFDAYHVMCDVLDLPNLASRSSAWWSHWLGQLLLGSRAAKPMHAAGERKWLWSYGPMSLAYRIVLSLAVVLWLGGQSLLLGLAAAAYVSLALVLRPILTWSRHAFATAQPGSGIVLMRLRLVLVAAAVATALFIVPLPMSTVAPAVVWMPEEAQVRAEVDGFIADLPAADGSPVKPGDLLVRLENPELRSMREQLMNRLDGLRVQQFEQMLRDPNSAKNLALDVERLQAELRRADERIERLQVRAASAGRLAMPRQADLLGTYVRHGATLGHVLAAGDLRVRAAVAQADAYLVQHRMLGAEVRLADDLRQVVQAAATAVTPAATRQLPSAALADHGGGPYAVDPLHEDGLRALEPVFLVDLTLSGGRTPERVGGRAWVRFDHGREPLAAQAYRRASQLFLRHFAPAP